ncbi:MAG: hypothetical protein ACRC9X_06420 [Bacteroidales bacterium]
MSAEQQPKLRFRSVDFPVVNFQSKKRLTEDAEIKIEIEPRVFYPKKALNHFNIIQEVHVFVEDAFDLVIVAIGRFELNGVEDEGMKSNFVNTNAPAIMFPYIRSFISTLTANLGTVISTLNIPPQFFKGDLQIMTEEDLTKSE